MTLRAAALACIAFAVIGAACVGSGGDETRPTADGVLATATAAADQVRAERTATEHAAKAATREAIIALLPTQAPPNEPVYDLEVESFSCDISTAQSYVTVRGRVKNVSGSTLEDIQAVADYSPSATFITSDTASIDDNPLLPDQSSPWFILV